MSNLPRSIPEEAFPTILKESIRMEQVAADRGGKDWTTFQEDMDLQREFLSHFEKNFSVHRSMLKLGVTPLVYKKWRRTSIHFVNGFNTIIDMWHDDIYVSAAQRARGSRMKDVTTESGYAEDADGAVLFFGADLKMQLSFLRVVHPEFNEKLNLNHSGETTNTVKVIKVQGVQAAPRPEPSDTKIEDVQ